MCFPFNRIIINDYRKTLKQIPDYSIEICHQLVF